MSKCGTHLGHNLPDGQGDRYCINLWLVICVYTGVTSRRHGIGHQRDRALHVTLSLKKASAADKPTAVLAGRYDIFAMCDCIIYRIKASVNLILVCTGRGT